MKILIIQQKMIGDVLTCAILCEMIKKKHPNYEVHYVVNSNTVPVVQNNPFIDKLVLFTPEYRKNKFKLLQFLIQIRKEKYNIVVDAYGKLESNLITAFSGAKTKISYTKAYNKFLYTHPINPVPKATSNLGLSIEGRQQLLEPLGIYTNYKALPKLHVTPTEQKNAIQLLQGNGINLSKKTIMISIIGSSKNKTYPLAYMSKVVDYIAETTDCNVLFNYIPNQLKDAQTIYDNCKKETQKQIYFDVLGKNLREFIAIMNQCEYIIGNDGGAINMAKALNKPSFIIFSPWIAKKVWATFEDGVYHKSTHLKDYKPELFIDKSEAQLKKNAIALYQHFKPEFLKDQLTQFITTLTTKNLNNYQLSQSVIIDEKPKISALIITKNEEKNIESIIENLHFTNEIIIVDSYSTDATVEKIKKYPHVKLLQNKFINFSNQRNFAMQHAKNNWILFIDADERIPANLKQEIIQVVQYKNNIVAYEIYRRFYFKQKLIRFSGWQTDKVFRLYKKDFVSYKKDLLVHELLDIKGKTGVLKHKLLHYSFNSYQEYKNKMNQYAKLRAQELFVKKLKPTFFYFYIKPAYRFFIHFIIRLGFLDGKKGIIVSSLSAYYVKQRYIELKKLYQQEKK